MKFLDFCRYFPHLKRRLARHLTPSSDQSGAPDLNAIELGEGHTNVEDLLSQIGEGDQVDSLRAVVADRLWYSVKRNFSRSKLLIVSLIARLT